jgi:hypothetical protein
MLTMNQIAQIKELQLQGYGPCDIASRLSLDRKTIRTHMCKEDFNQPRRVPVAFPSVPVLDASAH